MKHLKTFESKQDIDTQEIEMFFVDLMDNEFIIDVRESTPNLKVIVKKQGYFKLFGSWENIKNWETLKFATEMIKRKYDMQIEYIEVESSDGTFPNFLSDKVYFQNYDDRWGKGENYKHSGKLITDVEDFTSSNITKTYISTMTFYFKPISTMTKIKKFFTKK